MWTARGEEYRLNLQAILTTSDIVLRQRETRDEGSRVVAWFPFSQIAVAVVGGGLSGDENGCAEAIWKEGYDWSPTCLDWGGGRGEGEEEGFKIFLGD